MSRTPKAYKNLALPSAVGELLSQLFPHYCLAFHEFLRAAELKEPVQRATRFSD